ncbi:MAG: hypothetical protein GYB64_03190, partial [Chloroflexi bacterium]|nr:hypothetical protein [Chloroflexota bacterium]
MCIRDRTLPAAALVMAASGLAAALTFGLFVPETAQLEPISDASAR